MHYSIFTPNNINKSQLIKSIQANQLLEDIVDLSGGKAAFYTSFAIDKIIADEYKHDKIIYKLFEEHRNTHLYIQLFSRKDDILPYISTVIILDETLQIKERLAVAEFQSYDVKPQSFAHIPILFATADKDAAESLIEMRNVQVEYDGRIILQNVNWTIRSGEFWELRRTHSRFRRCQRTPLCLHDTANRRHQRNRYHLRLPPTGGRTEGGEGV